MAWVMPLIPIGIAAAKIYQNMQPDARQADSHDARKNQMVERLTSGPNPRVARMGDKQFEKFIKTNSIGRYAEEELRASRKNSLAGQ
jgi:hypothetical protein